MQITEREFFSEVESLAVDICETYSEDWERQDACAEYVDSHEWVIYYAKSMALCALPSSVTDAGENWLAGIYGETPYSDCADYGAVCTRLAYATMLAHLESEVAEQSDKGE